MRHLKHLLSAVTVSSALLLGGPARAIITIQDAASPIEYNGGGAATINSATFTVTPGASVLVVFFGTRNQGNSSNPGNPTSMKWNGNPLTQAVAANSGASTYDYNLIFYMVNPPAGTGSITGTLGTGVTQTYWMAYTLAGVSTGTAPLTNSAFSTSGTTINNTVANVIAGSWAAVTGSGSGNADAPIAISDTQGGTALEFTANPSTGNTAQTMGSVSNCPAGNNQFVLTQPVANQKLDMCEAIFTPFTPPPPAPSWVSVTTQNPAAVDLTWTASTNATSYILERGTNTGGPYTDFTNILNGSTTSYQDQRVISGTTYYYVVAAANGSGTNAAPETNATPVGTPFPPSVGAGASGPTSITVKWTPSFAATNYILLRSTSSGAETPLVSLTNTSYVDNGLTAGTLYYYEVEAAGAAGTSGPSVEASAYALASGWHLFDNFSLDNVNAALNGQTGSAGLGLGWTNLGGGIPITVTNSGTFGGANYSQYTPDSVANIGDYESGLGIAGNSTAATVFLEFSLPGIQSTIGNWGLSNSADLVAMNFDIDNSSPPGALTGSSATGPSAQFNYDNSTGDGFFRVNSSGTFYYACISPSNTPYLPVPGNVYYFWFVINAAKGNYQIYLADGSESGTNIDANGLGATPTLMWGTTASNGVGTVVTYGFRNVASGGAVGQPVNYIGTGPGSTVGTVPQNEFANIYVDSSSQNLTNPVTGSAATGTPQVLVQPQPVEVFAGFTASFSIVGSAGVGYQWESNGVPLNDVGNVSGSHTSTLTISNVVAGNAANYSCIVNNPATAAFASSTAAALTVVTPSGAFENSVVAARPAHYYPFDDLGNPASGTELAFDYTGGDDGVYGANAQNGADGINGPTSGGGFTGFGAANYAAAFSDHAEPNGITIGSPWDLDTNTVTITAWINPTFSFQATNATLVANHGSGADVEGLIFDNVGDYALGYEWGGDVNNSSWSSGLLPPASQWSFVALVVTPTNATMSLMYNDTYGMLSSAHNYPHPVEPFNGTTEIGDDNVLNTIGAVTYDGAIDSVAVYNQALSLSQLQSMFFAGSGMNASEFPATNSVPNISTNVYPGQTVQFSAIVGGALPLANTWQINGINLTDGASPYGTIIGSATSTLMISNISASQEGQTLTITLQSVNAAGPAFVSTPGLTMNVLTPNPATTITTTEQEVAGLDWNTGPSWSDGNPVSLSVYSSPGSTYEVVPGTLERSPISPNAVFPGNVLVMEGNGVLIDGNSGAFATQTTTGELRLKESGTGTITNFGAVYTDGGSITFPDLQLNGGQIDNGSSSIVALDGEIDVLANSAIYSDSAAGASIRSFQINALLTGTGTLTYSYLGSDIAESDIIISNPGNTFSGQWNILQGALLGNAANSLGTNTISIAAAAALETTYNVNNPHGVLFLNGQMYLYTDDTFYGVVINGTNVTPGVYTWAQLNAAYPAQFPQTWQVQLGSSTGTNTGTGSITILATVPPVFTQQPVSLSLYPGQTATFNALAPNATSYQWYFTNLSDVGSMLTDNANITGSTNTTLTIASVSAANAGSYVLVATDAGGSTLSSAATLTVLTPGAPQTITTTEFEPQGADWNTAASWSDALAANVSEFANPGSTYEIVPGTLERSPVSTNAVFPGVTLIVEGNGVLQDGNDPAFTNQTVTAELRLKENGTFSTNNFGTVYTQGGTVTFPDLQLNGGQLDNGNSSSVIINGQVDVLSDSAIYVDGAAAGSIRSIEVHALLTGSGTVTYSYITNLNYTSNDLIISGTGNTFTGQWHVEQGGLLGNAPGSLGTNSITVDATGALETTYNLNSPNATLTLNGQMYLYTADTFLAASVNGTALSPGTYSFAQLNTAYPLNFPSTWTVLLGSVTGTNTGSGSIQVLTGPAAPAKSATISTVSLSHSGNLTLSGGGGAAFGTYRVLTSTDLTTPLSFWVQVTSGSFDSSGNFTITFPATTGDTQQYYVIKSP